MDKEPSLINKRRLAAIVAAGLATLALTYELDGQAVTHQRAPHPTEKNGNPRKPVPYIYKEGDPIDAGIIAVNGSCDLYTDNVDMLVALRHEAAPKGVVYAGEEYNIPVMPCADPKTVARLRASS